MNKKQTVLICGGTGLVGSALLRKFIEKRYAQLHATYHNYKPHDYKSVSWHRADLRNQSEVEELFDKVKPCWVVLAAAKVGGILANSTYRAEFIYDNLMIQNHVIHQSYLSKVNKMLFLGSSCIYPKNAPQPMPEECLLTGELEYTNEPYAIAKIAGIKMCESYNLQYGTNFLAVMPTNLYGPNDNFDLKQSHVLPALIRKFHLGKCLMNDDWEAIRADFDKNPIDEIKGSSSQDDILQILRKYGVSYFISSNSEFENSSAKANVSLWGSGAVYREFLYSEDMSDACVFIMENVNYKEISNTHINIGTGKDVTIKRLANIIMKVVGYNGMISFDESKPDGTKRKLLDVGRLHDMGWRHKIDIEKGIKIFYDNYLEIGA